MRKSNWRCGFNFYVVCVLRRETRLPFVLHRQEIVQVGRQRRCKGESSVEFKRQGAGVERLAGKKKFHFQGRSPIRFDELQITIFIRPVDLVADNRVPKIGKMHANLVGSAGFRFGFHEGELSSLVLEAANYPE